MEIIEERLVGPSLGAANIKAGFESTLWGFIAVSVFMVIYYHLFGVFSAIALTCNLFLLVAIPRCAGNTDPAGYCAMALTLGMAVDANVLINERIREERVKTVRLSRRSKRATIWRSTRFWTPTLRA